MKEQIVKLTATGLGSGYLRPYAGTWGTIPAWLIAFFLIRSSVPIMTIAALLTLFISVWAAGEAEKLFGHDARKIVIDEWAGMFVTLIFIPYSVTVFAIGFVLFRFWDVVKLAPARQAERLPGGWGVTMDDIVAGIYANLSLRLIIYIAQHYFDYSLIGH